MNTTSWSLTILTLVLLAAASSSGQEEKLHLVMGAKAANEKTIDINQTSALAAPTAQLSLEGTAKSPTATGHLGVITKEGILDIKVSSPLSDDADSSESVTFDGLADKAKVSLGLTRYFLKFSSDSPAQIALCERYLRQELLASNFAEGQDNRENAIQDRIDAILDLSNGATLPNGKAFTCAASGFESISDTTERKDWQRQYTLLDTMSPIRLAGIQAAAAKDSFKFALSPLFAQQKESDLSYSAVIAYGQGVGLIDLLQGSYRYESSFKAGTKSNVCSPVNGSNSSICQDIATTMPEHEIKNVLQIEAKKFFSDHFAIDPTIAGDLRSRTAILSLPIYIFKAKDGGLNGGFTVAWRSDTKTFTGSVSIGQIFGLVSSLGN